MSEPKAAKNEIVYECEGELEGIKLVIPVGMSHDRIRVALKVLAKIAEDEISTPGSLLDWGQTN